MAPGAGAAFIGLETGGLHGITADGRSLWQAPLVPPTSTAYLTKHMPVATGMISFYYDTHGGSGNYGMPTIVMHDAATGNQRWSYTPPSDVSYAQFATLEPNSASRSDGVIFTVESGQRVIGIDEHTGNVVVQYALPTSTEFIGDSGITYTLPGKSGPLMVAPDGSVYLQFLSSQLVCSVDCQVLGAADETHQLNLVRIDPTGVGSLQLLHAGGYHADIKGNTITGDLTAQHETIPDGEGGVLAGWDNYSYHTSAGNSYISHVLANGGIAYNASLPFVGWCSSCQPGQSEGQMMVLGDNNSVIAISGAFASALQTVAALDVDSGSLLWSWQSPSTSINLIPLVATWGGGLVAQQQNSTTGQTQIMRVNGVGTLQEGWASQGFVPQPGGPLGLWAGIGAAGYTLMAQDSEIVPAATIWPYAGANPSGSRGVIGLVVENLPLWAKALTRATTLDPTGCDLPIMVNGTALPPAEPVSDATVPENVKLSNKLTKYRSQLTTGNWISSSSCKDLFRKLSDPNAMAYYGALSNAVSQQKWFNGHLSTITTFEAGSYQGDEPADKIELMKVAPISCFELTPPTAFQIENGYKYLPWLAGLAQLQAPANSVYFNGAALDWIAPGDMVHEAFHNVTHKNDANVRIILGMKPPEDPKNISTLDISKKFEDNGCAPGR
jgi:hypothetical protein